MNNRYLLIFIITLHQSAFTTTSLVENCLSSSRAMSGHLDNSSLKTLILKGVSFAEISLNTEDFKALLLKGAENKKAIIAFHGLGDWGHSGYASYFSNIYDADVFVPNMPYSIKYLREKRGIISMGGTADLAAGFAILKHICNAGYTKIGLYGFSCGGGIVLNMLYALEKPEHFTALFTELNIDIMQLKSSIKGCIVDRPFSSYKYTVKAVIGNILGSLVGLGGYRINVQHILNNSYAGNQIELDGIEPLEASANIKNIPLFIHGATKDAVVGFKGVDKIQKILSQNISNYKVAFAQSKCGHVDPISEQLNNSWVDFFKTNL